MISWIARPMASVTALSADTTPERGIPSLPITMKRRPTYKTILKSVTKKEIKDLSRELSNNPFSISLRMFRTIKMPKKAITAVVI